MNRLEKEKQDYLFCLEAAAKFKPREGVLLVEDDSLPGLRFVYNWFPGPLIHLDLNGCFHNGLRLTDS